MNPWTVLGWLLVVIVGLHLLGVLLRVAGQVLIDVARARKLRTAEGRLSEAASQLADAVRAERLKEK